MLKIIHEVLGLPQKKRTLFLGRNLTTKWAYLEIK